MADRISDLTIDEGVELRNALTAGGEALIGRAAESGDSPGTVAVGLGQVLGDLGLDAKVLDERDEQGLAEAVGTNKADLVSLARTIKISTVIDHLRTADTGSIGHTLGLELELVNGCVNALLGHLAVGGPLATGARQQTR